MKLAIMQPYLFPYIGYFQLISAVDKFIFYDDVNFMKQGWINRNKILVNGKEQFFTIPLKNISSFRKIEETEIYQDLYAKSVGKILKTFEQLYKKAPYFDDVIHIVKKIFSKESKYISDLAIFSVIEISIYFDITPTFKIASEQNYNNIGLDKANRLIDITKKEDCDIYINAAGGKELYHKDYFKKRGVDLFFIKPKKISYKQFNNEFVPWLSIIDVMMFNSQDEIKQILDEYVLI